MALIWHLHKIPFKMVPQPVLPFMHCTIHMFKTGYLHDFRFHIIQLIIAVNICYPAIYNNNFYLLFRLFPGFFHVIYFLLHFLPPFCFKDGEGFYNSPRENYNVLFGFTVAFVAPQGAPLAEPE